MIGINKYIFLRESNIFYEAFVIIYDINHTDLLM